MRLTNSEINSIKRVFLDLFHTGKVYLFGSRVDDTKRGGDIDLYFELDESLSAEELMRLKEYAGSNMQGQICRVRALLLTRKKL